MTLRFKPPKIERELPCFDTAFVDLSKPSLVKQLVQTNSSASLIVGLTDGTRLARSCSLLFLGKYSLIHSACSLSKDLTFDGTIFMYFARSGADLRDHYSPIHYRGDMMLHELASCGADKTVINLFALPPEFATVRATSEDGVTVNFPRKD